MSHSKIQDMTNKAPSIKLSQPLLIAIYCMLGMQISRACQLQWVLNLKRIMQWGPFDFLWEKIPNK